MGSALPGTPGPAWGSSGCRAPRSAAGDAPPVPALGASPIPLRGPALPSAGALAAPISAPAQGWRDDGSAAPQCPAGARKTCPGIQPRAEPLCPCSLGMSPRTLRTQLRGQGRALPSSAEHGQQRWRLPLLGPWEGGRERCLGPCHPSWSRVWTAQRHPELGAAGLGKAPGGESRRAGTAGPAGAPRDPQPAATPAPGAEAASPLSGPGSLRGWAGTPPPLSVPPGGGTAGAPTPACTGTRPSKRVSNGAGAQPERTQPREPPPRGLRAPAPGGLHRGALPGQRAMGPGATPA
ncbi:skin secretory protein xP2-like [Melozone crissalis]|uniref:skin secretory protein xP2-like n=1 Tax=Melozone crissalis TaxID=40204 RepID=UPI0023DC52A6|nr:skin secretory protein xP2-like [Melozone crissalis]